MKRFIILIVALVLALGGTFGAIKYMPGIMAVLTTKKDIPVKPIDAGTPVPKPVANAVVQPAPPVDVKPATKRVLFAARKKARGQPFDANQDGIFVEVPASQAIENEISSSGPRADNDVKKMFNNAVILKDFKLREPITSDMLGEDINSLKTAAEKFRETIASQRTLVEFAPEEVKDVPLNLGERVNIWLQGTVDGDLVRYLVIDGIRLEIFDDDPSTVIFYANLNEEQAQKYKKAKAVTIVRPDLSIGIYAAAETSNSKGSRVCIPGRKCLDSKTEVVDEFERSSAAGPATRSGGMPSIPSVIGRSGGDIDKMLNDILGDPPTLQNPEPARKPAEATKGVPASNKTHAAANANDKPKAK